MHKTAEVVSQAAIHEVRDQAIALARFAEAEVNPGLDSDFSHAASYGLPEGLMVVGMFRSFEGETDPHFEIAQTSPRYWDDSGQVELAREFTFLTNKWSIRPKYVLALAENIRLLDLHGDPMSQPFEPIVSEHEQTLKQRYAEKVRQAEITRLRKAFGLGELTVDKFQFMADALGRCGIKNQLAVGELAFNGKN